MELTAILRDVQSGLTSDEIMFKHHLSQEQLITIYIAWEKVNESTKRILAKGGVGEKRSRLHELYEQYGIGVAEREQIDNRMQQLREAILGRVINADEFDREVRGLVRNLLEKHKKE